MAPRAVLFDFNGTLSDDELILCEILQDLFAERGRPLSTEAYFEELAGHSDPEIVRSWLGGDEQTVAEVVREKIARYRARVADGSSVSPEAREAVRVAASRGSVAVVSGAAREEVEPVLDAAGLAGLVSATVTADDVEHGKPDPEGYIRALALLEAEPDSAVAFEDSEAGIDAARAAGVRCIAVLGTHPATRLTRADEIIERLDAEAVREALK